MKMEIITCNVKKVNDHDQLKLLETVGRNDDSKKSPLN